MCWRPPASQDQRHHLRTHRHLQHQPTFIRGRKTCALPALLGQQLANVKTIRRPATRPLGPRRQAIGGKVRGSIAHLLGPPVRTASRAITSGDETDDAPPSSSNTSMSTRDTSYDSTTQLDAEGSQGPWWSNFEHLRVKREHDQVEDNNNIDETADAKRKRSIPIGAPTQQAASSAPTSKHGPPRPPSDKPPEAVLIKHQKQPLENTADDTVDDTRGDETWGTDDAEMSSETCQNCKGRALADPSAPLRVFKGHKFCDVCYAVCELGALLSEGVPNVTCRDSIITSVKRASFYITWSRRALTSRSTMLEDRR